MMSCPSGHCICRTVQAESVRIWNDLQDAKTLNSPVHEDTITQTLALTLNRQHGGQCRVHLFGRTEESKNGSDFLWVFFSPDLAEHFRVAVQAKRLYPSGRYEAFKVAQAQTMDVYARSILAASVFVLYNFMPFRRGYYGFGGQRRCVDRRILDFDHGRDLGAIYVPTQDILKVSDRNLSARHIAGIFLPLWYPFCDCDSSKASSPLGELAERFTYWGETEGRDAPECLDTNQGLRRWMEGGRVEEGSIEDLFRVSSVHPSEDFTPSFVMGTRLRDGEKTE